MKRAKHKEVKFSPEEMAYEAPAEVDFSRWKSVGRGPKAWQNRHLLKARSVTLDPDVSAAFPDDDAVNSALRELVKLANKSVKKRRTA